MLKNKINIVHTIVNHYIVTVILVMMVVICGYTTQSQTDTLSQIDKVHLRDGSVLLGKVKTIKTDIVEFIEQETNLSYELMKSEIKVIILSSGKSLVFADEPATKKKQPQQPTTQPVVIEKDSGSSAGLVILASVGAILLVLLLIGAAAAP